MTLFSKGMQREKMNFIEFEGLKSIGLLVIFSEWM